jgi:hypothetical protein
VVSIGLTIESIFPSDRDGVDGEKGESKVAIQREKSSRNEPTAIFIAVGALPLRLLQNNAESSSTNYIQIEIIIEFKVLFYLFFKINHISSIV